MKGASPQRASQFQLPAHVRPEHYALRIEVDPARSRRFAGEVRIDLRLARAVDAFELHAVGLKLKNARVHLGERVLRARVEALPEQERVRIVCPERLPAGAARLELSFSATLRTDLRGLYFVKSGKHRFAFSQLEAADARRFFPCFDEPAFKAKFSLEVITGRKHAVVSNEKIRSSEDLPGGRKRVRFARTPLLSTYLIALAVGPLRASEPVLAGRTEIRVWHAPGQARLTQLALHAARECLLRLERYFGFAYPYSKLDLVAVPDFEIGAMENAGAVFFRETLLLIDERRASLSEKKRAVEVICHELAHMWYGNWVTMAWWDDLWLNEAFATWMAFAIVAAWQPELRMWNDFGHSRSSAFDLDALDSTHPIYAKVRTPAEATQSFDLITYEKGAAVIRMLERYLGEARFRRGVRDYIREHRESNARAADLWRALAGHAGQAVDDVVRPWIEREGFPLLRVTQQVRAGKRTLTLEQERFRARGPGGRAVAPWPVPVVLAVGVGARRRTLRMLLSGDKARVALPRGTRFVYANAEEGGFYRPLHDAVLLRELAAARAELDSSERMGLITHLWASVHAGYAPLDDFLDFALCLGDETDPDVLAALSLAAGDALDQLGERSERAPAAALRRELAAVFAPALSEIGLRARRAEPAHRKLLRAELLNLAAVLAEHKGAQDDAEALCESYLRAPGSVEANLVAPALVIGARRGDMKRHTRFLAGAKHGATPQERRRLRMALADFSDPQCVARTTELCLTDAIPTQDVALVLARMLHNERAREHVWRFVRKHWARLAPRMPAMLVGRFIEATPALQTDAHRRELGAWLRKHPIPTATRAVAQANERFERNARFRKRALPELARWLERRGRQP